MKTEGAFDRLAPEQREKIRSIAWDYVLYAETKKLNMKPRKPPKGRKSWGSLDSIYSPEWEAKTE